MCNVVVIVGVPVVLMSSISTVRLLLTKLPSFLRISVSRILVLILVDWLALTFVLYLIYPTLFSLFANYR